MAGWSELPQDLLRLIIHFLDTYTDQVRFACVCISWRSILPIISSKYVQPWLLLPRDTTDEKYEKFHSLHESKVHYLEVPEVLGKKFRGSSHGWLVSVEDSPTISLFNPITRVQITLPPRYKFPDVKKYCAKKFDAEYVLESFDDGPEPDILEASHVHEYFLDKIVPSPITTLGKGNFMVASIYGCGSKLAYWKLGDKKWTAIFDRKRYNDAIFYEEKLYALTCQDEIEVFDLTAAYPRKFETIEPPIEKDRRPGKPYLFNTSIGLLQVHRCMRSIGSGDNYRYQTTNFKLYLYESSSRSWCKVENIGENVLFLGFNTSISIASSYLPPGGYYKGNRIYFTDDNIDEHIVGVQGGYDIGFYDLDSRCITPLRCNNNDKYRKWMWPTPIWYIYNPEDFIAESSGACDKDEDGDLGLLDLFSCN